MLPWHQHNIHVHVLCHNQSGLSNIHHLAIILSWARLYIYIPRCSITLIFYLSVITAHIYIYRITWLLILHVHWLLAKNTSHAWIPIPTMGRKAQSEPEHYVNYIIMIHSRMIKKACTLVSVLHECCVDHKNREEKHKVVLALVQE